MYLQFKRTNNFFFQSLFSNMCSQFWYHSVTKCGERLSNAKLLKYPLVHPNFKWFRNAPLLMENETWVFWGWIKTFVQRCTNYAEFLMFDIQKFLRSSSPEMIQIQSRSFSQNYVTHNTIFIYFCIVILKCYTFLRIK